MLGIRHPAGLLHGNFVVAVLSDLFGIQARSGCFCAGRYLHRMYAIDDPWSEAMHEEAVRGHLGAKLPFARISSGPFISEAAFRFVLDAVHLVAGQGLEAAAAVPVRSRVGPVGARARRRTVQRRAAGEDVLERQLVEARRILATAAPGPAPDPAVTEALEAARWFPLPSEAGEAAALPSLPRR